MLGAKQASAMVTHHPSRASSTLVLVSALLLATASRGAVKAEPDAPSGYEMPPWQLDPDTPPTDYQPTDAPPPPVVLSLRLMGADGGEAAEGQQQGVVQLFSPQLSGGWGALCVSAAAVLKYGDKYDTMAKLICRQLGKPQRYARLLPASALLGPAGAALASSLPMVALVTSGPSPCPNDQVATVADCSGVLLQPTPLTCGALEQGDKEPAAVVCAGYLPPVPPAPPSPPPRAPPLHLTTRLVDSATGQPAPGARSGRLEVLLGGSWGTVCGADPVGLSAGLAQYACLQAGQPTWRGASFAPAPSASAALLPASVPVWLVAARDCKVVEGGTGGAEAALDCWLLAGPGLNPRLLLPDGGLDEDARLSLLEALGRCSLSQPSNSKHQLDVFVECPEPPEPSSPSRPPAPPQRTYDHGVAVQGNEVRPNIYELTFVQQNSVTGMLVNGTVCSLNGDNGYFSLATKQTLCANLTGGARPYGSTAEAPLDLSFPFLPSPEERKAQPVLLDAFECHDGFSDDYTALPDLSYCQANLSRPVGRPLYKKCWTSGWASTLLVCSNQYTDFDPEVVGARLEGGPDGTTGRLEVLLRDDLQYDWSSVCDDGSFTRAHAQAVCRDLGLDWTGAEMLSSAAASSASISPPPAGQRVLMADIRCESNVMVPEDAPPPELSFVRDCSRAPSFLVGDCPDDQVVGLRCAAAAAGSPPPPPMPPLVPSFARPPSPRLPSSPGSSSPPYGGHYYSPPPLAPPPPYYSYPVVPPPPYYSPPPAPCTYGGYYGCHDGGGGGYGGYGGYGGNGLDGDFVRHDDDQGDRHTDSVHW